MKLKRLYYKLTSKVPTEELNYNVKDFEKGMRWAKSLPHPSIPNRTLDEYFYRWDSVEVLAYLNELIRKHNKGG